jgi:hypothetical protein
MREGLDWWMDLLTTYTHDSELQAITAPPLISTIHKSPQHLLSLFQPAVSSSAIPWQRFLTVEILQLHALRSSIHRLRVSVGVSSQHSRTSHGTCRLLVWVLHDHGWQTVGSLWWLCLFVHRNGHWTRKVRMSVCGGRVWRCLHRIVMHSAICWRRIWCWSWKAALSITQRLSVSWVKSLNFFMLCEELPRCGGPIMPRRLFCKAVGWGLTCADCGPEGDPLSIFGCPRRKWQYSGRS